MFHDFPMRGDHDYEFISEIVRKIEHEYNIKLNVKRYDKEYKDRLIRMIYENKLNHVPIIVEGGVSILDSNINKLISKLRNIEKKVHIIVFRDADSDDADDIFNNLRSRIYNTINDPHTFNQKQYKPRINSCNKESAVGSFNLYQCKLEYKGGSADFHFILIVRSLESFLGMYGYSEKNDNNIKDAIEKAVNDSNNNGISLIIKSIKNELDKECRRG